MQSATENKAQAAALEGELANSKHELLKIREMLEMAEKVIVLSSVKFEKCK